ncbi:DNA polymerase III subunit gamma and tau [Herbiconiux sp. UC225_62]|uniref:DNA polymerase III subunit gamma and tau n=1 Tax=Herbiconiux sp. UC225_62 TaxID=3350168 RepID=UPI0036D3ED08
MVTALYRRYRPENFAEMIGQSQVTDPLMTALRTNRVNHAYLFSGPRGCGKTTSARILARCLNCAEGPTDKPCGVCPSCVELSRDGMGSLDVVEIDAASHGGVDDARDLRERAIFAPARDRYKIFIIDEAHMVTSGGFNALLKIVEEPPEHIKFIFATTEPDKVIGTIRSRTHHYPFRLIPPAQLLEYVQQLCETEGVEVAPGVLPLVVRAGGGSARDTLSLLDQLIAGSENNRVEYEQAVALLGYTHGALLSEVIDAIGAHDGAAAFDAVDRVIQTGQDPRRFVEDLLERLRDIIIVSATRESASSVLRGVPAEEIEGMRRQAAMFGHAELSRVADIVNDALTEMTGATSPRLHLELMIARTLVPASDDTERGALVRVERLERRIGVDGPDAASGGVPATRAVTGESRGGAVPAVTPSAAPVSAPAASAASDQSSSDAAASPSSGSGWSAVAPGSGVPSGPRGSDSAAGSTSEASSAATAPSSAASSSAQSTAASPDPRRPSDSAASATASPAATSATDAPAASAPGASSSAAVPPATASSPVAAAAGEVSLQQFKDAWPEILEAVQKAKMTAWLVVYTAQVRALDGDVLTLAFPSENDVASFKERSAPGQGVSEYLRQAIVDVLGLRVKYIARVDSSLRPDSPSPAGEHPTTETSLPAQSAPSTAPEASTAVPSAPSTAPAAPPTTPETSTAALEASSAAPVASATAAAAEFLASLPDNRAGGRAGVPTGAPQSPPTWSTPGVSDPGPAIEPEPESTPASSAPRQAPVAPAQSPRSAAPDRSTARGAGASRPAASSAPSGAGAAVAPTTSWDVVAIPTSSDEEPPPFDEPMPSDEPELPADRAGFGVAAGAATARADQAPAAGGAAEPARADSPRASDPAARPGALRFEASGDDAPVASAPPPTATAGGRARYGEAVVREILGANFIEEQPLPGREG